MPEKPGFSIEVQERVEAKAGETAAFRYDRMTDERFRSTFPGAPWHVISGRGWSRGPLPNGGQIGLPSLDVVFRLPARAVDVLIDRPAR